MTTGVDRLDYPEDPSSPAVSILDTKIHINSTIPDAKKGARYTTLNINNFTLERRWYSSNTYKSHNVSSRMKSKTNTTSFSNPIDIPILKLGNECMD